VQIRQRYPGHALKAGLALSGGYMGRFVVVVDEDINPRDTQDVLWAMGSRCDPATSITVLNGTMGSALDPRIPPDKKARGDYTASQAIVLACKPYDWIQEFPKTNVASPELRAQMRAKWRELF
jgi:4-hydroxy-3-polyprenylbenzoate decarboxylase